MGNYWRKIWFYLELSRALLYRQLPLELPFVSNNHADVANIDTSIASTRVDKNVVSKSWVEMFQGELSAAVNKYWCVFSGRIIYTEKEEANFQTSRPFLFTKFKMNAQQVPQCKQSRVTYLLSYTYVRNPIWIETTVRLFLLYICHTVIHRKLKNVVYMKKNWC